MAETNLKTINKWPSYIYYRGDESPVKISKKKQKKNNQIHVTKQCLSAPPPQTQFAGWRGIGL